jgi:hypothetical protein
MASEAGKGDGARPMAISRKAFRDNYDLAFGKLAHPEACGDCKGTGKISNRPCPVCAPTDDGPGQPGEAINVR